MKETDIPVVEIVLSGQNLALLFSQARALGIKRRPRLALIGFENTQDSIAIAIHAAQRIKQAVDLEKRKAAEFSSLVNYSLNNHFI